MLTYNLTLETCKTYASKHLPFQVCLVDINKAGEGIAAELKKKFHPASVEFFNCDVTDYTAFEGKFFSEI